MKKISLLESKGFVIVEAMLSLTIGVVFLSSVLGAWYYSTLAWKQESTQSGLRFNLQSAMEMIKTDVRLSDANKTLYYPAGLGGPYSAISIPATTRDANGFFTMSSGTISWTKTIIYHVYTDNGAQELRRTVYNSFNSSDTARQSQINNVVANGGDTGNATTTTIGKADTIAFEVNSSTPVFDGYSATTQLSSSTDFGNVRLAAGTHQIRFLVTGKNASSSGYRMGIDSITLSPSGGSQEAEALSYSSGSGTTVEDMSALLGGWGGNYHVECSSGAGGDSITFSTYYDQWLETNFYNMTHSASAVSGTNPHLTVQSREDQGLAASWTAEAQSQGANAIDGGTTTSKSIRTVISGSYMNKSANMIRIKFLAGSSPLTINAAYFGVRSPNTPNFTSFNQLYFDNA